MHANIIKIPICKVDESEYVEDHLHPALHLATPDDVHVDNGSWVIQAGSIYNRPVDIPMYIVYTKLKCMMHFKIYLI